MYLKHNTIELPSDLHETFAENAHVALQTGRTAIRVSNIFGLEIVCVLPIHRHLEQPNAFHYSLSREAGFS